MLQLFEKLCQKTCDTCGNGAAYIDVFNLSRQCLNVGGECQHRPVPQTASSIFHVYNLTASQFAQMGIENCFQHKIHILPVVSNNRIGRVRFYDGEAAAAAATQEVQVQEVPNQKNSKLVAVRVAYLHKNGDGISSVTLCSGGILNSFYTPMLKLRPHLFTTDLAKVSLYFDEEELRSHQTVAHPDLTDDPHAWQEEVRRWLRIQRTID
ncbi:hypothetical protein G6514_007165 [Epicoccum nigrum]|nr:hypothetical protein G6514_007165 [Epicoccum nigrum]